MHRHDPKDRRIDRAAIEVRAVQEKRMGRSQHQREKNTSRPTVKESVNLPRAKDMTEKQLAAPSLSIVLNEKNTNA
jgi:hypothetical protein